MGLQAVHTIINKIPSENSEELLISPWEISCINGQKVNFNDSSNKLDGINQAMISIIDSLINEGKYAHLRSCNELLSQFENNHDDLERMTSKISITPIVPQAGSTMGLGRISTT